MLWLGLTSFSGTTSKNKIGRSLLEFGVIAYHCMLPGYRVLPHVTYAKGGRFVASCRATFEVGDRLSPYVHHQDVMQDKCWIAIVPVNIEKELLFQVTQPSSEHK